MDDLCAVCHDTLEKEDDDIVTLNCNHKYHYNCIFAVYKDSVSKNKYKSYVNCPYCRKSGGYLPLKLGMIPIKGIHHEYSEFCKNKDRLSRVVYLCNFSHSI